MPVQSGTDRPAVPPGTPPVRSPRPRPQPLPRSRFTWHRLRKSIHFVCFLIFIALPFFDVMRFDIPKQRFYLFGQELWISEFGIIFLSLMLTMFVIGAMALYYGRVWCAYLCPQMIFSEVAIGLEARFLRFVSRQRSPWLVRHRKAVSRALIYAVLVPASVVLAFVFVAYYVEPRDLLRRLLSFDASTAGGIAGVTTTILLFADFAFLRLRFCTTVCPYGYLQGFVADDKTLLVAYRDEEHACIECKKCVKICHMGIDIRDSGHQIECVHCGECIDACDDVLGRLGKPGLIHYMWGEKAAARAQPWYRRAGLLDPKRIAVGLMLVGYASALWVAIAMRDPVLVRLAPDRSRLYDVAADGRVSNRFRLLVANRSKAAATVAFDIVGLERAELAWPAAGLAVPPGTSVSKEIDLTVTSPPPGVHPFQFVARWGPTHGRREFPMTFIAPEEGGSK